MLSGIPYWNTDIGGFFSSRETGNQMPTDPRYQEIFTRWFQYGAFTPTFRVHGSGQQDGAGIGKEIYRFPDEVQVNLRTMLNLRYRLLPYTYSVAWRVSNDGYTLMRPMVMDFSDDPEVLNIPDQFMYGPAIMVNPVSQQGATSRDVYLPKIPGGWIDFWTGKRLDPRASRFEVEAPISRLPLFVRAGSIVPMGPLLQYTGEKPADPIEIRIYRGADGEFTLYEDEGNSYRYEEGAYATIGFSWNNTTQTLTIGACKGHFPGMLRARTFNIVVVEENHGNGVAPGTKPDHVIHYSGTATSVEMGQ
jgi:alpha-D-xyloside xylohydrolase